MLSKVLLIEYFHCLATFNYDKAKQIIDTSNFSSKIEQKSVLWKLFESLLSLITLEKKYYGLTFLGNKRKSLFSRKEKHGEGYQELFDRMTVTVCDRVNEELGRDCLILLCSIRSRMTEMYLSISQLGRNGVKCFGDIVDTVRPLKECLTEILNKNKEPTVNIITPLLSVIELEVEILLQLGEAQNLMSNLYFLVPINLLYSVDEKCQRFQQLTSILSTSMTIFSRSSSSPALLNWLSKFYVASLAKYTLYFHSVLMRQKQILIPNNDCFFENTSLELLNRISAFTKRTTSSNILLMFDAAKQNIPFLGHGYVLPFSRGEKVSGIRSFPVVFSWPLEMVVSKQLLCNLVNLVLNIKHSSENVENIEHVIEPNNSKTYFLSRVEERMYLAIVFDGRREKDKVVTNFMEEIKDSLSGKVIINELFSSGS